MTFHICIVYHLFFVCAGKMTEDSRITPPYWSSVSASPSLEAGSAAGRSQPPTSSSSSLACFASSSLLWPAFTDYTVHQEGGPTSEQQKARDGFHLEQFCIMAAWRILLAVQELEWGSSPLCGATSSQTQERAEDAGAGGNVLWLQSLSVAVISYSWPVNTARRAQFSLVTPGDTHTQMLL